MEISLVELEQLARKLNTQESVKRDSREDDHFVKYFEALKSSLDAALKENAELKITLDFANARVDKLKEYNSDKSKDVEKLHAENRRLEEENTRLHGALSSVIESFHFVCYECSSDITVDNSAQHKNGNLVCKECAGK